MDVPKSALINNIYLYLVSFVALMMVVLPLADLVNVALKTYVFTKADRAFYYYTPADCGAMALPRPTGPGSEAVKPLAPEDCAKQEERNKKQAEENRLADRQRNLVRDISFLFVGIPLFIFHWRLARKKSA